MNRTDRAMQQLCKDVIVLDSDEDEAPSLSDMARRAAEILGWLSPKRKAVKPMKRERMADEARETAAQIDATARLRVAVFVGNEGMCAVHPGESLGNDWHMHHIESGGLRRERQTIRNCAPVCERAHLKELHKHNLPAMEALRAWCVGKGYVEAAAILERRIEKVKRTRARRSGAEGDGK